MAFKCIAVDNETDVNIWETTNVFKFQGNFELKSVDKSSQLEAEETNAKHSFCVRVSQPRYAWFDVNRPASLRKVHPVHQDVYCKFVNGKTLVNLHDYGKVQS